MHSSYSGRIVSGNTDDEAVPVDGRPKRPFLGAISSCVSIPAKPVGFRLFACKILYNMLGIP